MKKLAISICVLGMLLSVDYAHCTEASATRALAEFKAAEPHLLELRARFASENSGDSERPAVVERVKEGFSNLKLNHIF